MWCGGERGDFQPPFLAPCSHGDDIIPLLDTSTSDLPHDIPMAIGWNGRPPVARGPSPLPSPHNGAPCNPLQSSFKTCTIIPYSFQAEVCGPARAIK